MVWGAISSLFFISWIKFMFAPFGGPALGLTFLETYSGCVSGAILSSALFYFSADYLMDRATAKRIQKQKEALKNGSPVKRKKNFTRMNKFIVKIKRSLGQVGICFWAPFFLSIPIGSIISAKFYGHSNKSYPLIVLGIFINGIVTTGIAYLF
ncbi:MAG: hypothetical protein KC454_11155 [Flavobacteriales bacterium]|nr:hypothetical protein [Flavobacteriales bacterium]